MEKVKQSALELKEDVLSIGKNDSFLKLLLQKMLSVSIHTVQVIKKAAAWLRSAADSCNKSKGTPFEKCIKSFQGSIIKCR